MNKNNNSLGQHLVKNGLITEEQLAKALKYQSVNGGKLGAILVDLGIIKSSQLLQSLSAISQTPIVKADEIFIDHKLIKSFEYTLMLKHDFVPVASDANTIKVATSDPFNLDVINIVEFETEKSVELCIMSGEDINKILNLVYHPQVHKPSVSPAPKQHVRSDKIRSQIRNASFREVLLALVDELNDKGLVKYSDILKRVESRQQQKI